MTDLFRLHPGSKPVVVEDFIIAMDLAEQWSIRNYCDGLELCYVITGVEPVYIHIDLIGIPQGDLYILETALKRLIRTGPRLDLDN